MFRKPIVLAALITSFGVSAQEVSRSTFFLNPLGGNHSIAYAINDEGVVAGRADLENLQTRGFVWSNGASIDIGTLGGSQSRLYGVNNYSVAVGMDIGAVGSDFGKGAVKWASGALYDLDPATSDWQFFEAHDINDSGTVVGQAINGLAYPLNETQAVLQRGSAITLLTPSVGFNAAALAVNDHDVAVGWSAAYGVGVVGSIWQNGKSTTLASLGFGATRAHDINNSGLIVGESLGARGFNTAVVWENGQIRQLQGLTNGDTLANALNEKGQIVGSSYTQNDGGHAVLWENGEVIDLNLFLTAADLEAGWALVNAFDINESGWVVGEAYNRKTGLSSAFVMSSVSAVPEPSAALSLVAGLAMIGFVVARKAQR